MGHTGNRQAAVIGAALIISGVSGLVNQVVWQRALRVYLAGSESLSGMIVVLVFLLGLSLGAWLAGRWSRRISRVILAFAAVEFSLCFFNLGVSQLLRQDLSQSVFVLKALSDRLGISLLGGYTFAAVCLLLPPCTLMGATTPLAAESIQRIYRGEAPIQWISRLLFLNTLGACMGALLAGLYCLPVWGQSSTLLVAAGANGLAGVISLAALRGRSVYALDQKPVRQAMPGYSRRTCLTLGFVFGFSSLVYEMWLFRALALAWLPLPSTFSACLGFFLLFWNLGVSSANFLLNRVRMSNFYLLVTCAASLIGLEPIFFLHDRAQHFPILLRVFYFMPCFFSGLIYATLVRWAVRSWGGDTGAFLTWNTLGACLGVLLGQMVGYQMPLVSFALSQMLVLALVASGLCWFQLSTRRFYLVPLLCAGLIAYLNCYASLGDTSAQEVYNSTDGVLEVRAGDIYLDGLWHSSFNQQASYTNDWLLGAYPALLHRHPQKIRRALVVGFGLGRTVECLQGLPGLQDIDAYEINRSFRPLFKRHQAELASILGDPRVHLHWQDGRSGVALSSTKYDLISCAPLYLKQSGSSLMLSESYFKLLLAHLNPGGVAACYSWPETKLQGILVRQTFARVFPYTMSAGHGYLLLGSNAPLDTSQAEFSARLGLPGLLFEQARGALLYEQLDLPRLEWDGLNAIVTDDRPLVEYAHWIPHFLKVKPQ